MQPSVLYGDALFQVPCVPPAIAGALAPDGRIYSSPAMDRYVGVLVIEARARRYVVPVAWLSSLVPPESG